MHMSPDAAMVIYRARQQELQAEADRRRELAALTPPRRTRLELRRHLAEMLIALGRRLAPVDGHSERRAHQPASPHWPQRGWDPATSGSSEAAVVRTSKGQQRCGGHPLDVPGCGPSP